MQSKRPDVHEIVTGSIIEGQIQLSAHYYRSEMADGHAEKKKSPYEKSEKEKKKSSMSSPIQVQVQVRADVHLCAEK